MSSKTNVIGEAVNRIDGLLKVTGTANYAMDFAVNNSAHVFLFKYCGEENCLDKSSVKGIGEVGIVGVAASVANAIFNATGKRIRELPVTPDKLI